MESILDLLKLNMEVDDAAFDRIFPPKIQKLTFEHWTPLEVAKKAADYLVTGDNCKVLDVGSGAGKFCTIGSLTGDGQFYGVEQRLSLVKISRSISENYYIDRVNFIHANICSIDFLEYDSFYFYNPFQENLSKHRRIDTKLKCNPELYFKYVNYVREELLKTASGTRVVTYWCNLDFIPNSFKVDQKFFGDKLVCWQKD